MLLLTIQSISDVITNSSSEIFCTITSKDIETIYEILKKLFPGTDSELYPYLWMDENNIYISLPYGLDECQEFYDEGLKAILYKNNIKDYEIKYE